MTLKDNDGGFYCSLCGVEIREEQSAYGLCEVCESKALARFRGLMFSMFTEREREYLSDCVEGVGMADLSKIQPIRAVYGG